MSQSKKLKDISNSLVAIAEWLEDWGMYIFALVIGYSGQRIAYKYLGAAEQILEKKVDGLNTDKGSDGK